MIRDMAQLEKFLRDSPFWLNLLIFVGLAAVTGIAVLFIGWLFPSCINRPTA